VGNWRNNLTVTQSFISCTFSSLLAHQIYNCVIIITIIIIIITRLLIIWQSYHTFVAVLIHWLFVNTGISKKRRRQGCPSSCHKGMHTKEKYGSTHS